MGNIHKYLREYGSGTLSYSSLQCSMQHHVLPGAGYIAYDMPPGEDFAVALGDPVCAQGDRAALLDSFLAAQPNVCFLSASRETSLLLAARGYHCNAMGCDAWVGLAGFGLRGTAKRSLRSSIKRAQEDGAEVREVRVDRECADTMRRVSRKWIAGRRMRDQEYRFLSRPAEYNDEPGVRKFAAFRGGEMLGFVFFDPVYANGAVTGYAASVLRSIRQPRYSVQDAILLSAIAQFRSEGAGALSLGLMPFHDLRDETQLNYSPALRSVFAHLYQHGGLLLNSRGLAFHKSCYSDRRVPVFFASRSAFPLRQLHAVSRLCGLRPVRQATKVLWRSALSSG